ncbi:MAG: LysM peptidoglycan-binding domain-containing protein, partial [Candidatus Promineifilaceae bacterium]
MQTDKGTPYKNGRSLLIVFTTALLILLLVACESSSSQETLSATVLTEKGGDGEIAATDSPTGTLVPTAWPTQQATQTSVLDTPTPLPTETPAPLPTDTPAPLIYVVKDGDNLWLIAEEFKTSMNAIQIANELADGSTIYVGQELLIPMTPDDAAVNSSLTESLDAAAEADESKLTPEARDSTTVIISETPTTYVTGDSMVSTAVTAAPEITKEAGPAERTMLHNSVRCPVEEDIKSEDGAIIGKSAVCGIPIVSYQLGDGETPLILIGGIHGGYEWNTILLAY